MWCFLSAPQLLESWDYLSCSTFICEKYFSSPPGWGESWERGQECGLQAAIEDRKSLPPADLAFLKISQVTGRSQDAREPGSWL